MAGQVSRFVVVLTALTCCGGHEGSGITLLIESAPDSLDDRLALTAAGQRIAQLISPGLITFNDQSEPVPDLAESYRQLDAKTLEFTLRDALFFHNGARLTAHDVKATFEAILRRAFPTPKADRFEAIASVEVADARTVRFHLKRPYAPILAELSISIVPAALARAPDGLSQDQSPVGAGPFRWASSHDEEIELLPFDRYYLGRPAISALHIRVVRDETTRVLELLKGRADLAVGNLTPAILPALKNNPSLRVLTRPGTGFTYLAFNLRGRPFDDLRVRQAVCHALNVGPIVEAKFHRLARPATGMLPASHWAFAPTSPCRSDPAEARRLLAEAGYRSTPLRISLKTSTDRFRKSIALIIQAQLAQVGIVADVRSLEFGTLFSDVRKGSFEMVALKWATVIEPDLLRGVFSSKNIPGPQNSFAGWNRGAYVNPHLDEVLENAAEAQRPQDRQRLYLEAQEILARDLPYVPLWHEDVLCVASSRLAGFEPSALGFLRPLAKAREARQ